MKSKITASLLIFFFVGVLVIASPAMVKERAKNIFTNVACHENGFEGECFQGPNEINYNTYQWKNKSKKDSTTISVRVDVFGINDYISYTSSAAVASIDSMIVSSSCKK